MGKTFAAFVACLTAVLMIFGVTSLSVAQEAKKGHSHANAEMHGGTVAMTKQHHFEVVFKPEAIQLYLYDGHQKPVSAKGVKGEVTLKFKDGKPQTLSLEYAAMQQEMEDEHKGMMHDGNKEMRHEKMKDERMKHKESAEKDHHNEGKIDHDGMLAMDYLQTKVDLIKVEAGAMKAVFNLKGLPNEKETSATFTETFNGFSVKMESNENGHDDNGAHKH